MCICNILNVLVLVGRLFLTDTRLISTSVRRRTGGQFTCTRYFVAIAKSTGNEEKEKNLTRFSFVVPTIAEYEKTGVGRERRRERFVFKEHCPFVQGLWWSSFRRYVTYQVYVVCSMYNLLYCMYESQLSYHNCIPIAKVDAKGIQKQTYCMHRRRWKTIEETDDDRRLVDVGKTINEIKYTLVTTQRQETQRFFTKRTIAYYRAEYNIRSFRFDYGMSVFFLFTYVYVHTLHICMCLCLHT